MNKVQATAIIRDRGQLTIPDSIRAIRQWIRPQSVVTIASEEPDEIIIRPHQQKKEMGWDKIWELITKARSIKGKKSINAAQFLARDRQSH